MPSERAFSVAGLTLTKLRSRLDPDTVDSIIFAFCLQAGEFNEASPDSSMSSVSACVDPGLPADPACDLALLEDDGQAISAIRLKMEALPCRSATEDRPALPQLDLEMVE